MHDALRADVYNALLTDSADTENKNKVGADFASHVETCKTSLDLLTKSNVNSHIKLQAEKLHGSLNAYITSSSEIIKTTFDGTVNYNSIFGKQKLAAYQIVFNNIAVELDTLTKMIEQESLSANQQSSYAADNVKIILIILFIAMIGLSILGIQISNMISKPIILTESLLAKLSTGEIICSVNVDAKDETGSLLRSLNTVIANLANVKEFVTEVGNGNFNTNVSIFDNKGEIFESLNKMKADLKNTAEEDKKRNWTTEGLAKFGDILRNNTDDLAALANNIISNLVKYIGANQGGLFVINDHNTNEVFLELIACYAWEKKKFIEKKVQKSEGLVGQVWQEGELIYITDIPQDFIKITSGLGGANPNSILVVPLKVNEETYGVIELASFQKFEQYQIDFMTKLAESIASTLAAAKTNERTKFLLEQSQQQTEEMRAQEEEMRQNMEEMQATQEEMERKERELASQTAIFEAYIKGVNNSMLTIEFTPEGYIMDANANFLAATGYSLDEIKGKHHRIFVKTEEVQSASYQHFWADLANGKSNQGEFRRVGKTGSEISLKATYTPIIDIKTQKVFKVVKFAMDITNLKN